MYRTGRAAKRMALAVAMIAAAPTLGQNLFHESGLTSETAADPDLRGESIVLRSRTVALDRATFSNSLANDGRLVLNLFPDTWLEAKTSRARSSSGTSFVYAKLQDGGHASLLVAGGIVRGAVHSPQGTYTIRAVNGTPDAAIVRITQVDTNRLPPVDDGGLAPDLANYRNNWSADNTTDDTETDGTVDLVVFYTPAAEAIEGGRAEVEAMIIAEVENANQALARLASTRAVQERLVAPVSEMQPDRKHWRRSRNLVDSDLGDRAFRLLAMERVEYAVFPDMHDNLRAFKQREGDDDDPDGVLDEVHAIREAHGADLAHLFLVGATGSCGSAFALNRSFRSAAGHGCSVDSLADPCLVDGVIGIWREWAFGLSRADSGCPLRYTFPHELGHNLGLFHDRYRVIDKEDLDLTKLETFPATPYGFGYVNQNFERSECARTLLALSTQCGVEGLGGSRLLMFSDPHLAINDEGDAAGIAGDAWTEDLNGPADAARAVEDIWEAMANLYNRSETRHHVPFVPKASDPQRQGFVRVVNHDAHAGEVAVTAYDDAGASYGPITLSIDANETTHFNSDNLEDGDADKGLPAGVGQGEGDWRLELTSPLDIEILAYIRTTDGFLTAMHDPMPASGPGRRAPIFNPASNENQVSLLRLVNTSADEADVVVTGVDDDGMAGDDEVRLTIPPYAAATLTAQELEVGGDGFEGAFGDGSGKWRLFVERVHTENEPPSTEDERRVFAMSLLSNPTGHLTNLSTMARNESKDGHAVPLFPAKSAAGRQGFVRIRNQSDEAGVANVIALDDAGDEYGPVTLELGAGQTRHFNSDDLEDGNANKGLSGGIGEGDGDWRLRITSDLDIEVLAYVRTDQGFLTSMHDAAPSRIHTHRLAVFNPAVNVNQVSSLRMVNTKNEAVEVTLTGIDDLGKSPGSEIQLSIPPKAARTFTSQQLEPGSSDFDGSLDDGHGKWQLIVDANHPLFTMSLLESPTGHLTNLSTAPVRGVGPWPPEDVTDD